MCLGHVLLLENHKKSVFCIIWDLKMSTLGEILRIFYNLTCNLLKLWPALNLTCFILTSVTLCMFKNLKVHNVIFYQPVKKQ